MGLWRCNTWLACKRPRAAGRRRGFWVGESKPWNSLDMPNRREAPNGLASPPSALPSDSFCNKSR